MPRRTSQVFDNVERPAPLVAQLSNLGNEGARWTLHLQLKLLFRVLGVVFGLGMELHPGSPSG